MSFSAFVSCIEDLANYELSEVPPRIFYRLSSTWTIESSIICNGLDGLCHGFNLRTYKKVKISGYDCDCILYKCRDCAQTFWDEDEEYWITRGVCFECANQEDLEDFKSSDMEEEEEL